MKKIMTVVLVALLGIMLVACGKTENTVSGYKTGDVTLGEYKGIRYSVEPAEVTEEQIDAELETFLYSCREEQQITDRAVETGDTVSIDYVGYMDGVAFEGGTGSHDLEIGSGAFIPGFEDGLVGANIGDVRTLDLTFPDPYQNNPDYSGKAVTFEVTVNAIKVYVTPELTDELVDSKTSYTTIEAYRKSIRGTLSQKAEQAAAENKEYTVIEKAIANTTFNKDLSAEIADTKSKIISNYDQMYQSYYGYDSFTVYQAMYGFTAEEFDEYMASQAEMSVKYSYMLSAVADVEKLTASDEEIDALIDEMLASYGYASEDVLNADLINNYNAQPRTVLADQVKMNKATELILSTAVEE